MLQRAVRACPPAAPPPPGRIYDNTCVQAAAGAGAAGARGAYGRVSAYVATLCPRSRRSQGI